MGVKGGITVSRPIRGQRINPWSLPFDFAQGPRSRSASSTSSAPGGFRFPEMYRDFHKDPADRIIVATARVSDCPIVTVDKNILNSYYVNAITPTTS